MATDKTIRTGVAAVLALAASLLALGVRPAAAAQAQQISIEYTAFDGRTSHAIVLLPSDYTPGHDPSLPLVISPHGRGLDGAGNARRWGDLPSRGNFAVINPDGEGAHLGGRFSWGAPGEIDDLARMPAILASALPWVHVDPRRIYALGGSMGGQETLLLLARHPHLLAGAVAVDPLVDFARQYRNWTDAAGSAKQALARREVGGTPETAPDAYAARSPLSYVSALASSGVPLQIWWSRTDRVITQSALHSGLLAARIEDANPAAPLTVVSGEWRHTSVMWADAALPQMLAGLGLLPDTTLQR